MNQGVSLFYAPLGDNAGAGYIKQPGCASLPILAFHIADGNVSCSPGLLNALAACASDLEQAKSSDPRAIASSLKQVLAKVLQTSAQPPRPSVAACIQVSKQLELLGWDRVTAVEENFCSVGLVHVGRRGDGGGAHALRLFLDVQGRPYECMSDTPLPFVLLPSNVSSVSEAYARFATHVARFEQVWQELEEVDASARVLDPPLPANRGLCYRRLGLLDENQGLSIATLHVQMAIDNPRGAPCSCELIGPETAIAPHRGRLDAMFRDWVGGLVLFAALTWRVDVPRTPVGVCCAISRIRCAWLRPAPIRWKPTSSWTPASAASATRSACRARTARLSSQTFPASAGAPSTSPACSAGCAPCPRRKGLSASSRASAHSAFGGQ
jgi:hypothetical protein